MTQQIQVIKHLMILSILLGCSPPGTQPVVAPTPTLPAGWESHTASANPEQCAFVIDHPSAMDFAGNGTFSWTLGHMSAEPSAPFPNFLYISVITDDFQSGGDETIYNFDPGETQTLLDMQIGENRSLREDATMSPWFTYTRLPDVTVGNQAVQVYENTQPWEFPLGTKEIRYYLRTQGCTYLVGGYIATVGSGQPGAIDEETFDRIIASFRLAR